MKKLMLLFTFLLIVGFISGLVGDFTGSSFSVANEDGNALGITWNGTNFYVYGRENNSVFEYDSDGVYTGFAFSVASESTTQEGITWNGSSFWVAGEPNLVSEYNSTGNFTGFQFSTASEGAIPSGIAHNGTSFWVVIDDGVFEYNATGNFTGFAFSTNGHSTSDANGITWNDTHFFLIFSGGDEVITYNSTGNLTGFNFSVANESSTGRGITYDDVNIFVLDAANDTVYEYEGTVKLTTTLNSPTNSETLATKEITFNITSDDPTGGILVNVTLYINNTVNETITISGTTNITTFNVNLSLGAWEFSALTCNNESTCVFPSSNNTFTVDKLVFGNEIFNTPVLEQTSQTFKINFSLHEDFAVSEIILTYNNTNSSGTFTTQNTTTTQGSVVLTTPSVGADVGITFNWSVILTDDTLFLSSSSTQTINDLSIDDCSVNTVQILNFTLVNEETQLTLTPTSDNTSIKIDLDLFISTSSINPVIEFNQSYNQTLPARVCVSSEIANASYIMDVLVEYDADGFAHEFYNIQQYDLNGTTGSSQNITLFDLADSEAQRFKITFKDESFLPVGNALIQIQRKYVEEGVSKTVEIPKTNPDGEAPASLVLNDVIYTFTVVKNGVVLGTFINLFAICQNPTIEDCIISLNSFSSTIDVIDFANEKDFSFTLSYAELTRVITSTFTIPSGTVSTIFLNVTKEDALGTEVCNEEVTTSAGTLTCTVGKSFGNGTVLAQLYKDNVLMGQGQINLAQEPEDIFGANLVMLGLFIMVTLIGAGISDNPVFTVLFLMIGVILLFAMNLVDHSGFIGVTATILWLIMAFILIIIKAARRT